MSALPLSDTLRPYSSAPHPTAAVAVVDDPTELLGANPTGALWSDPRLTYFGGDPEDVGPAYGARTRPTGGDNPQSIYLRVKVTGPAVGIHVTSWGDCAVPVYVDGHPVTSGALPVIVAGLGYKFVIVTGLGPGTHEVTFVVGFALNLLQVIAAEGTIIERGEHPTFTAALLADSYGDLGISPFFGGLAASLHARTGWEIGQGGQGSTGYTNDGASSGDASKSVFGSPQRRAAIAAFEPDIIIIIGSVNDGAATPAAVHAAATALYAALAPTPLVVLGVQPLGLTGDPDLAQWDAINGAVREAATAAENVLVFLDWRSEDWLTGSGTAHDPHGDGNQDIYVGDPAGTDLVHLNYFGQEYLASRIVDRIASLTIGDRPAVVPWYSATGQEQQERLEAAWLDAPLDNLETLGYLLTTARAQVSEYAGAIEVTADGAQRLVLAQLMQARNLWNAGRADSGGDIGDGGFVFTPRPMDKTIRQIIRPIQGGPDVY